MNFTTHGVSPDALYRIPSGSGTFAPESIWKTVFAQLISVVFLGVTRYLSITNYPEFIEGSAIMTTIFMT